VITDNDGRPKRTFWWCTASVCNGSALLDLFGINRSVEREFFCLFVLKILLSAFIVYRLLLGILNALSILFCVIG